MLVWLLPFHFLQRFWMNILWGWQLLTAYLNCSHYCIHKQLQYDPLCRSFSPGRRGLAWSPHQTPRHNLHFLFLLWLETPFVTWSPTSPADSFGWRQVWGRNHSFNALLQVWKTPFWVGFILVFRFNLLPLSFLTCIFCQLFERCLLAVMTPIILLLSHASFPWHFSSAFTLRFAAFAVDFQYNVPK